jgi:hypothetical protein
MLLPLALLLLCAPLSTRQRRVRAGRSASLVRATLRFAFPAVRGLVARRRTHFAHCVRFVQTAATSQSLKRAARAATSPLLLGAPEARHVLPTRAFAGHVVVFSPRTSARAARRAVPGRRDLWGGEERSTGVGARSALRALTRRICLNEAHAVRVVSYATRAQGEYRSEVGAKRRPHHQREPLPGTARRVAQTLLSDAKCGYALQAARGACAIECNCWYEAE